jgi:DNA-binding beta-propeller fold protein YncE
VSSGPAGSSTPAVRQGSAQARLPIWLFTVTLAAISAAGCEVTPVLSFDPGSEPLNIGQLASVVVEEGGEGATLVEGSFTLTDAQQQVYDAQTKALELTKVSDRELRFTTPAGVAPGKAALSVETSKGPAFSGEIEIQRLIAIRDLGGKTWLPALVEEGEAQETGKDLAAGKMGFGQGKVSVGDKGRLMASIATGTRQLYLAWLGRAPKASSSFIFNPTLTLNDVLVTPGGITLVGTSNGTYLAQRPTKTLTSPIVSGTPLQTDDTLSLAVDRAGTRAVALARGKPGTAKAGQFLVALIDLIQPVPTLLHQLTLPWTASSSASPVVAVSDNAKHIVVVDSTAGKLVLFIDGKSPGQQVDLPAGQEGAVAIAVNAKGDEFYVANQKSRNLGVIKVSDTGVSFGGAMDLKFGQGASDVSGAPVDVAVTAEGTVVILLQHDLVLRYSGGTKAKRLTFKTLFSDKISGEEGGALSIQP